MTVPNYCTAGTNVNGQGTFIWGKAAPGLVKWVGRFIIRGSQHVQKSSENSREAKMKRANSVGFGQN